MWWLRRWLQTEVNARLSFFSVKLCDGCSLFSDVVKAVMKIDAEVRAESNKLGTKKEKNKNKNTRWRNIPLEKWIITLCKNKVTHIKDINQMMKNNLLFLHQVN